MRARFDFDILTWPEREKESEMRAAVYIRTCTSREPRRPAIIFYEDSRLRGPGKPQREPLCARPKTDVRASDDTAISACAITELRLLRTHIHIYRVKVGRRPHDLSRFGRVTCIKGVWRAPGKKLMCRRGMEK